MNKVKVKDYWSKNIYASILVHRKPKSVRRGQYLSCCVCGIDTCYTFGFALPSEFLEKEGKYYYIICSDQCRDMFSMCKLAYTEDE